jgi:hypothetical protein
VHWGDATTLEFLDYLLAPGRATGVPMVFTCRSEEAQSTTLSDWLERLHRNQRVRRLELAPLTVEETAEQIELLLGPRPSPMLIDDTYARSDGNAFFTEQIVAAASADGTPGVLPASLTALLLSRIAQVDDAGRDVLAALAVAGRPLDESALVRLCDRPDHEVRQALRDLRTRRLLQRPDAAGRHHALLGEAIHDDLLPSEQRELHGRVACYVAIRARSSTATSPTWRRSLSTHLPWQTLRDRLSPVKSLQRLDICPYPDRQRVNPSVANLLQ